MLDFSDASFSEFFATELQVNIDDPKYAEHGGSKGKRLRCFLQKCDDPMAVRTLNALWEHRCEHLARTGQQDPVLNAEARFGALIDRLGGKTTASPTKTAASLNSVLEVTSSRVLEPIHLRRHCPLKCRPRFTALLVGT